MPALWNTGSAVNPRAVLISSSLYRRLDYGRNHPLGIPRVSLLLDLIRSFDAIRDDEYLQARNATVDELCGYHDAAYVRAVKDCEQRRRIAKPYRKRYNIGNFENPWIEGIFTIPSITAGASIQGAEQVLQGKSAFNPAGGMHHAGRDRARGFCFFNDAVLGVLRLLKAGLRILYLDIDAHFADGVVSFFRDDARVLSVSIHMDTAYAYPRKGGGIEERGDRNTVVNLPLPAGVNDGEYRLILDRLWPRLFASFEPEAVVLQAGVDTLGPDPLGKFRISTQLFLEAVQRTLDFSPRHVNGVPRLLVLGGGGYHPITIARAWTGLWGLISGRNLPETIPPAGQQILRSVDWEPDDNGDDLEMLFQRRLDTPMEGPIRQTVRDRLSRLMDTHPLLSGNRS